VRRGAEFVDVELGTDETLAAAVAREIRKKEGRTKLIISYHDFKKTSSYRTLRGIYNRCISRGADIVKIVTFARTLQDNLTILRLVDWAQGTGGSIIAHCMGEKQPGYGPPFWFISGLCRLHGGSGISPGAADRPGDEAHIQDTGEMKQDSRTFAVFGNPVAQSLSPLMIGAAFREMKIDASYQALRVENAGDIP